MPLVMHATLERIDLDELNGRFEKEHPSKVIEWAAGQFGDDLVMTSSFGAQGAVLLHLATQVKPDIKVIFIDTGYLFPETHRFMEQLRLRLNLNVWTYRTKTDPIGSREWNSVLDGRVLVGPVQYEYLVSFRGVDTAERPGIRKHA